MAILLSLLGMLGCKSIERQDLLGTWVIEDVSQSVLPAEIRGVPAKIIFYEEGTFVASEMPGLFYFPGRHAAELESGTGTWKLVLREGEQQVQLNFQTIAGWRDALPYGTQLYVSRSSLYYFLGDPDEGRRISFVKK